MLEFPERTLQARDHLPFQPEIQGLRAVAVLIVLIFHIWPAWLPGGFVGVDIFFVISGFLITGLLLIEAESSGRIRLGRFWARRVRRLLPAATLVLLAALAGTILWLPETTWMPVAGQVVSSALYMQNWTLAIQSVDYAARGEASTAVQHYWSLSIEEQFYVLWPILAFVATLVSRRTRRSVGALFFIFGGTIFIFSLGYSIFKTQIPAPSDYFVSTTRAWELALGCILAVASRRIRLSGWLKSLMSSTGLAAIIFASFFLKAGAGFPGWVALAPTLGAVFVLAAGGAKWSASPVLASRPLKFIGDISYSIYLWHWPIIVFLHATKGSTPLVGIFIFIVSIALATLSKFFVEDPLRKGRVDGRTGDPSLWRSFAMGIFLVALVVMVSQGFYWYRQNIKNSMIAYMNRLKPDDPEYPGATALDDEIRDEMPVKVLANVPPRPDPLVAQDDRPTAYKDGCDYNQQISARICEYGNPKANFTIILTGDSHAAQYLPAFELLAAKNNWRIGLVERAACMLGSGPVKIGGVVNASCDQWQKDAIKLILDTKPDLVVTSAGLPVIYETSIYQLAPIDEQIKNYKETWQKLQEKHIPVVVIRDNPRHYFDVPACAQLNRARPGLCSRPRNEVLDNFQDSIFLAAGQTPAVQTLDLSNFFCIKNECPVVIGNVLMYRDGDHLTATYVKTLAPYLGRWIKRVFKSRP
jgi:peptidoglycan/LPS O-acetylase OafA/YrhL